MAHFSFVLDGELLAKFRYLAGCEYRSASSMLRRLVAQVVADFEQKHGPIPHEKIEPWL